MKISCIQLRFCSICHNRALCLPEKEFLTLNDIIEKYNHRDFLYFKKGEYLFKAGDEAEGVFCIYTGSVRVLNGGNPDIIVEEATDGAIIGFYSIVDGQFIDSALSADDTFCCFWKIAEVRELLKQQNPVAGKILSGH